MQYIDTRIRLVFTVILRLISSHFHLRRVLYRSSYFSLYDPETSERWAMMQFSFSCCCTSSEERGRQGSAMSRDEARIRAGRREGGECHKALATFDFFGILQ